ncbi:MAG TPA: adenylate/guanylate cyclase domain-containing protein [Candidatus Binatia bacterium]
MTAPAHRDVVPVGPLSADAPVPGAAARECVAGIPLWLLLLFAIALTANVLASATTNRTIDLMRSISPYAQAVRRSDVLILPYWQVAWYVIAISAILLYLWPLIVHFRRGTPSPAPLVVQRRVVGAPIVVPLVSFIPWVSGAIFFPLHTLVRTGRWSPELLSQHIYSPLVNGFLCAATIYLLSDWLFRTMVVPRVFPSGRLPELRGARALGVRGRMLIFLVAVAFLPLFTMLGLVRSGLRHIEDGAAPAEVVARLASAGTVIFLLYVALGVVLTLVLAQTLTRPLACVADTLRRVRAGDLAVRANLGATDEIGLLEDGVNALVETLQDRERILHTFGRAVDPLVRDRLLASDAGLGGELRRAAVLFCDLRGFTAMAERTPPQEVVATLNAFFSTMTAWVRSCGGFVDKFIGDAMLVVFGLLEDTPDGGAGAALRCALGMRERLAALNEVRAAAGQAALLVSVGVHAGEVLAGRIGAEDRYEYTVIGDAVNVAARLQQLSKESAHGVLVSADAYELAAAAGVRCTAAPLDAVSLRGRREAVRVFALT